MNKEITKKIKREITKEIKKIGLIVLIFITAALPFKYLVLLPGGTEVRPVNAVPVIAGLLFGVSGAIGITVGNFICDLIGAVIQDAAIHPIVLFGGLFVNFMYAYLPYFLWYRFKVLEEEPRPVLKNTSHTLKFICIAVIDSALTAAMIGIIFLIVYQMPWIEGFQIIFLNNFNWIIILGIPILLFIDGVKISYSIPSGIKKNYEISPPDVKMPLKKKFLIGFLLLAIVFICMIGLGTYMTYHSIYQELGIPVAESLKMWNRLYYIIGISCYVALVIVLLFLHFLEISITNPIALLSNEMKRFVKKSDKLKEIEIHSADEIEELNKSFIKMAHNIEEYIAHITAISKEKERIQTELNVATQIQASMLPSHFPAFPHRRDFDIYAVMCPAKEVGGDFYDFYLIDEDHLCITIADVSGKGVPAALFMAIAKALIKAQVLSGMRPEDALTAVNRQLYDENDMCMFVTAFLGIIELSTNRFTYVNAGYNPPLVCHPDTRCRLLESPKGFVLAAMEDTVFSQREILLNKDSILFLYTDGVTEAMNPSMELYGENRLFKKVSRFFEIGKKADRNGYQMEDGISNQLISYIQKDVHTFENGAEQADDITILALLL